MDEVIQGELACRGCYGEDLKTNEHWHFAGARRK
ncbi:MAG: hypothetical protein RLZZ490_1611 [Cyanobacteriota bacterium]|jgi:hypothetical protein